MKSVILRKREVVVELHMHPMNARNREEIVECLQNVVRHSAEFPVSAEELRGLSRNRLFPAVGYGEDLKQALAEAIDNLYTKPDGMHTVFLFIWANKTLREKVIDSLHYYKEVDCSSKFINGMDFVEGYEHGVKVLLMVSTYPLPTYPREEETQYEVVTQAPNILITKKTNLLTLDRPNNVDYEFVKNQE